MGNYPWFFHGCAHFFAIFVIYYLVLFLVPDNTGLITSPRDPITSELEFIPFVITGLWVLFFGWFFGSTIMGVYLFTTLNLYRRRVAICAFVIVLICSFLMFAMWFNAFLSTLLFFSIAVVVCFLYKIIPSLKKEIPFLHSNEAFSSLRVQDYKGFLRFKITKDRLESFFIGIDEIPEKWKNEKLEEAKSKWKAEDKTITPKLVDYWTVETPSKSNKKEYEK